MKPQPHGRLPAGPQPLGGRRESNLRSTGTPNPKAALDGTSPQDFAADDMRAAVRDAAASAPPVWGSPTAAADARPSTPSVDRCETLLRSALERQLRRFTHNPVQGVQQLFQRLDRNHSGRVDVDELSGLCDVLGFEADKKDLWALFARFDLERAGNIGLDEFSRAVFRLDGDAEFKARSAIGRMREVLALRAGGYESLRAMGTQFRIMDRDHSGGISKEEFDIALSILFSAFNVRFTVTEKNALFQRFDADRSGAVSYEEFVRGVRGSMNQFRLGFVKEAFNRLDRHKRGHVTIDDLREVYDVTRHPEVQNGNATHDGALMQLLRHYDTNNDGVVSYDEFVEGYEWVSASIDGDDYFELMMRDAWHISGGEGWCANCSNLRVLVTYASSGKQEVVEIVDDMDLPSDPAARRQAVLAHLDQQGFKDIANVEFHG